MLSLFFLIFYSAGAAVILGIENLLKEQERTGEWVINLPKFLLVGIPLFYLSLSIFFHYFSPPAAAPIEILIANKIGFMSPS